jgi:hypothetical protein
MTVEDTEPRTPLTHNPANVFRRVSSKTDYIDKTWKADLCHPEMSWADHFLYTIELSVLWFYGIAHMMLETIPIMCYDNHILTFEGHYLYNCMFLSQLGLSWLYLFFRMTEYILFYALFDFPWSCFPLVQQGRIKLMEYLSQQSLAGIRRQPFAKPDYKLSEKYQGPCIPLRSTSIAEVFADPINISLQTIYGKMGPSWKYLGETRLKYWSKRLEEKTVQV